MKTAKSGVKIPDEDVEGGPGLVDGHSHVAAAAALLRALAARLRGEGGGQARGAQDSGVR